MPKRVARFRSDESRRRFYELYDCNVAQLWPVPAEELDVATSYGMTRVRRCGAGPGCPVVLVHGNSGTSVGWYLTVAALARRHQVLTPDTIGGLGRSVQTRPLAGTTDLAVWFREVLDGMGVGRVHLVGFSEGGFVAFHAALGNADRLASMVAIDAGGTVERIRLRFWGSLAWTILKVAVRVPNALRDFGQRLTPGVELDERLWEMMTTGAKGFRQALPTPRRVSDDHLRRLTTPTLLYMAGNSEIYDARKAAIRAWALMPDVEVVIVEGANHGLPLTHPEKTWGDILDFTDRHEPLAPAV